MKTIFKTTLIVLSPFLFMLFVNNTSTSKTFSYLPNKCTRYCEEHGCKHTKAKYSHIQDLQKNWVSQLYFWNIKVLGRIPGLTYKQANIAVYFVVYPFLIFILLYRLLKWYMILWYGFIGSALIFVWTWRTCSALLMMSLMLYFFYSFSPQRF